MYRLLIVDDERHIVNWLLSLFSGLTDVDLDLYAAYSAEQALDILDRTKMDIVFSDICMPGLSGFDLADRIKQNWPASRLIFLTGFLDFQFAYKANQYDFASYLLKTEDDEKIIEALKKAIASIRREHHTNLLASQARASEQALTHLREKEFVREALGGHHPTDDMDELIREAALDFSSKQSFYLMVAKRLGSTHQPVDMPVLQELTKLYLGRLVNCCCAMQGDHIWWIIQEMQDHQGEGRILSFESMLETFLLVCRENMGIDLFMLWFPVPVPFEEIGGMSKRLLSMLDEEMALAKGQPAVYVMTQMREQEISFRAEIKAVLAKAEETVRLLEGFLAIQNKEQFFRCYDELVGRIDIRQRMHAMPSLVLYQMLAAMLLKHIAQAGLADGDRFSGAEIGKLSTPAAFLAWHDAAGYLRNMALMCFQAEGSRVKDHNSLLVDRIKRFIQENTSNPISLDTIARMVNYNASYISRVFRQETGRTLSEQIMRSKVDVAKDLLMHTDLSVQDVAQRVGFDSSQYFSTVFRKAEGVAPGEYKLRRLR